MNHALKGVSARTLTKLAVAFGIVLAGILTILEVRHNPVVIEPMTVPDRLRERGLDGAALSNKLLDELLQISREATTLWERRLVAGSWGSVDIVVPAAGFSFQAVVRFIRHLLRIPESRVSGELVESADGTWSLTVRLSNGRRIMSGKLSSLGDLNTALRQSAEQLWSDIDPFTLAGYYWSRDPQRALEIAMECLARSPATDDHWAFNLWGNILLQQRQAEMAIVRFQQAAELDGSWWVPHHNWGIALLQMNRVDEALERFRTAVSLGGGRSVKLITDMGTAYSRSGNFETARTTLERAVQLDRTYPPAFLELVRTYGAQGHATLANRLCAQSLALFAERWDANEACGDVSALAGDVKAASKYYGSAARLMPMTPQFCLKWAGVLERAGEHAAATTQYKNVLVDEPTNQVALGGLTRLAARVSKPD